MPRPAILCVDDERTVLVSLKEQLRRRFGKDYVVETAESGEAALEILDELLAEGTEVPVVISDHIMPGLKGDELLARIEAIAPDIKKIMLTGQATADAVGSAVNKANLFRYLSKPWAEADLNLTVGTALESFDTGRRLRAQQATLRELNELALDLTAELGNRDRYDRLVARIARGLSATRVALFGVRQDGLRRLATFGGMPEDVPRVLRPATGSALHLAMNSDGMVRGYAGEASASMADELGWVRDGSSEFAIALRAEGELRGLLVLTTRATPDASFGDRVRGFSALTAASMRTAALVDALEAASERQRQVAGALMREADGRSAGPMHGSGRVIRTVLAALGQAATRPAPVLLVGLPGTGHEAAARHVHRVSELAEGPFLTVQAAAIQSPEVLDLDDPASMPWLAQGGTLHVVGVDRLTAPVRDVLLRTLRRLAVGGADVPVLRLSFSTTLQYASALEASIDPELVAHLRTRIVLPPLRDRVEDIPVLARFYLRAHATRLGRSVDELPEGADAMLAAYPWPGNVEELEKVMERAVLTADGRVASLERAMLDASQAVGSYRLLEKIGAGGMGEVWKAKHEHLTRPAAVKLITAGARGPKDGRDSAIHRFRREAMATSQLRSPHTVELYDFGILEAGDLYYVMELLDGVDLDTLVSDYGELPAERVVMLLVQACHSLLEAHEAGLIHRDIKPSNLFACRYGPDHDFLKVLDFGMVTTGAQEDASSLTRSGAIVGTPSTMAPEIIEGKLDHRADLYGLGCTAYYLLTGRNVFISAYPGILLDHVSTPPVPPSKVTSNPIPVELEELVLALLAKDPAARPPSARDLRNALLSIPLERPWTEERAAAWWATFRPRPSGAMAAKASDQDEELTRDFRRK